MFLSMNWISDFVDLTGLDKMELIRRFSLSTAEVENDIFHKGSDISGIVVAEIKEVADHPESKKLHLLNKFSLVPEVDESFAEVEVFKKYILPEFSLKCALKRCISDWVFF